jgi:hypothetical protein
MRLLNFLVRAHHLRSTQLDNAELYVKLAAIGAKDDARDRSEDYLKVIESMMKTVEPYVLLGIPVTTASFRTVGGYLTSCIVIIFSFTIDTLGSMI